MSHYEVKGHINTIVFIGNIVILQFSAQNAASNILKEPKCRFRTNEQGPKMWHSLKAYNPTGEKKKHVGSDCSPKTVFILRPGYAES